MKTEVKNYDKAKYSLWLEIDHQKFRVSTSEKTKENCEWYERQLQIALKRFAAQEVKASVEKRDKEIEEWLSEHGTGWIDPFDLRQFLQSKTQ